MSRACTLSEDSANALNDSMIDMSKKMEQRTLFTKFFLSVCAPGTKPQRPGLLRLPTILRLIARRAQNSLGCRHGSFARFLLFNDFGGQFAGHFLVRQEVHGIGAPPARH